MRRSVAALVILVLVPVPGWAYVEKAYSVGEIVAASTNVLLLQIEKVDKERNLIIYKKVRDLKGVHPTDTIKHNIGKFGFHPREWQAVMDWAEPGKLCVMFHNGGASENCIGTYWYQAYNEGDWWKQSHGEPFLLRTFAGKVEKFAAALTDVLAGKDTIVPCMVDGSRDDLALRRARIQRLKVSLKLQDYNPKRDFAGWGGEDLRRLVGVPGFTHQATLGRCDPEAQAISCCDFDGDGKPDLCLVGAGKVALLQNGGEAWSDAGLPGYAGGARAAVWADYNGDGKPDLFLATGSGPKLYTNLGNGQFRDDSQLLPKEPFYNLTSAAWIDFDGDGKPDLLLANGFHGLRLYRNRTPDNAAELTAAPKLGPWHYCGPFDNTDLKGFDKVNPPEQGIDLAGRYDGKNGEKAVWKPGTFVDGAVNDLVPLFRPENRQYATIYLYRTIESATAIEMPASFGSDDTLTVWLNGDKLHSENVQRACAPDQAQLTLKLKPGVNHLLIKVTQGSGEWAYYFRPGTAKLSASGWFEDVSAQVGLGPDGIAGDLKGDALTVVDMDGDGRPDVLYGAGTGVLLRNTPQGFVEIKDSGIRYTPGKVAPAFADFDGDGLPDLFVPQPHGGSKLFHNDGHGHFTDVTAKSGDLAKLTGHAVCAAWGDLSHQGRPDLVVGCLRGPNKVFRNRGDGTFTDITAALGLDNRIFNTQAVALLDVNGDGSLDLVLNNEGQDSVLLLGAPVSGPCTPIVLQLTGRMAQPGARVRVLHADGRPAATQDVSGGDGRGGQGSPFVRFTLPPGKYVAECGGKRKELAVTASPMRVKWE